MSDPLRSVVGQAARDDRRPAWGSPVWKKIEVSRRRSSPVARAEIRCSEPLRARSCSSSSKPRRSISWTVSTSRPSPRAISAIAGEVLVQKEPHGRQINGCEGEKGSSRRRLSVATAPHARTCVDLGRKGLVVAECRTELGFGQPRIASAERLLTFSTLFPGGDDLPDIQAGPRHNRAAARRTIHEADSRSSAHPDSFLQ